MLRKLNLADNLLNELQHGLRTCHLRPPLQKRGYPANSITEAELSASEQKHAAGLMRVNNAGEVAAQGLYRGQAFSARSDSVRTAMKSAADEENEHLNWCQQRLSELDQKPSRLDGLWYWGSFSIGALAGVIGDRWSLGFVRETELQVSAHLEHHLSRLPVADERSKIIITTMKNDEMQHAINAQKAGAANLPPFIKSLMRLTSKVMTFSAYRI